MVDRAVSVFGMLRQVWGSSLAVYNFEIYVDGNVK